MGFDMTPCWIEHSGAVIQCVSQYGDKRGVRMMERIGEKWAVEEALSMKAASIRMFFENVLIKIF